MEGLQDALDRGELQRPQVLHARRQTVGGQAAQGARDSTGTRNASKRKGEGKGSEAETQTWVNNKAGLRVDKRMDGSDAKETSVFTHPPTVLLLLCRGTRSEAAP